MSTKDHLDGWTDEPPYCDGCGAECDAYTVIHCWACNSSQCPDCNDAHGFLCEHFRSDWEG